MQAMTDPSIPPTPPSPPADGPAYTPKARMPGGGYWLLITAALLALSLLLAQWASSIPPVYQGPHVNCSYHLDRLADDVSKVAFFMALGAGVSAFAGVFGGWGWRWWFLLLLLASPVVALVAGLSTFYFPPSCPGPFS
jgi:hypothetical protein